MAVARTELQVTWATAANNFELATGNSWAQTSEVATMTAAGFAATIQLKADVQVGTPDATWYIDFFAQLTHGDPDGTGDDEYDTTAHDIFLCRLDVNAEDPALKSVNFPAACAKFKIRALAAGMASTDTADISATLTVLTA